MIFLKKILPRINHLFCTFIESYKKKMEEQADLRRQLKLLESKNTTLMQSNIDLEEDIKKAGNILISRIFYYICNAYSIIVVSGVYIILIYICILI